MVTKLLQFSLTQRLVIVALTCILIGFGVASWRSLPLDAVPDITPNQVIINTEAPGRATEEVEKLVTVPVEAAMGGIPGVDGMRSLSTYGLSQVTVTFKDNVDTYFARQLVNERLGSVREQIPVDIHAPQLGPVATGLGDIYYYALESDTRSPMELRSIQDWVIRPQLRSVPGVVEVNAMGGEEKQYEVQIDPSKMQARGVALSQVVDAVERNNGNAGGGLLERGGDALVIRSIGTASSTEDIEDTPVDTSHGTPILVKDVAAVRVGSPPLSGIATKDGHEAVAVSSETFASAAPVNFSR